MIASSAGDPTISAVIVTFNPDEGFVSRLEAVQRQVPSVTIVDNGSENVSEIERALAPEVCRVELIRNPDNEGVAHGLNQGLQRARERGSTWALTLDQDSEPAEDMVREIALVRDRLTRPDRTAVIGAHIVDVGTGQPGRFLRRHGWLYQRASCAGDVLDDVTRVITSGSFVNLAAYASLGPFREDFFIDYVDTEYCLRAQRAGFRIAVACRARLYHRLGHRRDAKMAGLSLQPTHHSPTRWYYLSRNRIPMIRTYAARFPHWFLYEVVAGMYGILRMLAAEDRRGTKLRNIVRGTWDGLRGRMGPIQP